jgi:hypothetical protein
MICFNFKNPTKGNKKYLDGFGLLIKDGYEQYYLRQNREVWILLYQRPPNLKGKVCNGKGI